MAKNDYGDYADFDGSYEEWLRCILDALQGAEYAEYARHVRARLEDAKEQWEQ
jgi:hypothetical protein